MTLLITGARGAVSAGLLDHLIGAGADVRAASSTPQPDQSLLNLHDPATFAAALHGVSQVFLYANAATAPDFARAAAAADVQHIVLLSSNAVTAVADPDVNPMAAPFLAAEAALRAGPVPVTVLRPGSFASNARQWAYGIRAQRAVDLPYPDARVDAVDEGDISEVAYRALTEPGLRGATLDLTGPDAISLTEQIRLLAAALGEEIGINRVTREDWTRSVNRYMPGEHAAALLDYWQALELHPAPISPTVAAVTGRPATAFRTWVERHVDMFR
jgi:uncharacterized protein YbjT (DUF2867 family)